ncbi:dihydrofolate reductase [Saliniramus sp.]|uniref:dihydrofolate reductase n=1 Tax=Saliniramus sp. TaxID=2986772 RepID=UPI002D153166|nr:dihydrofolate reductase [Saliniramus sp.]HMB10904.1 dihydrofolate reductase [Saliniramus sp.]
MTAETGFPLTIVAAIADNGVIGDDNRLIWRLKSDLRRFKQITLGKPMIMGRKTFDSIGRPLPGRRIIVMTRDPDFAVDGVDVARSFDAACVRADAVAQEMGASEIIVAGGSQIYAQALPAAQRLRLTRVHAMPDGDAHFPDFDSTQFRIIAESGHGAGPDDEFAFTFIDMERR